MPGYKFCDTIHTYRHLDHNTSSWPKGPRANMGKLPGENRWNYQFAISSISKKIKQIILYVKIVACIIWHPASIAQWEHLYSLWYYNKMKQNIVVIVLSLFVISNWLTNYHIWYILFWWRIWWIVELIFLCFSNVYYLKLLLFEIKSNFIEKPPNVISQNVERNK